MHGKAPPGVGGGPSLGPSPTVSRPAPRPSGKNGLATCTIAVNERTEAGESLVSYLRSLGVIDGPDAETLAAVKDGESAVN